MRQKKPEVSTSESPHKSTTSPLKEMQSKSTTQHLSQNVVTEAGYKNMSSNEIITPNSSLSLDTSRNQSVLQSTMPSVLERNQDSETDYDDGVFDESPDKPSEQGEIEHCLFMWYVEK